MSTAPAFFLGPLCATTWSELPPELLREIILFAAADYPQALSLRLVSSYFNSCILPVIFRHVYLYSTQRILRVAATISPRRKIIVPALQPKLRTVSRALDTYMVDSMALCNPMRLPSAETALENVAAVFTGLRCLAITASNLSAHAFWLRKHSIRPTRVMVMHFGRPTAFNFREPIFSQVTHLFTPVLLGGHRGSSVEDLPALTHLAVQTHANVFDVALFDRLGKVLAKLPKLQRLVLCSREERNVTGLGLVRNPLAYDKRFILLPYFRGAREEWADIVLGGDDVWSRAEAWVAGDTWSRIKHEVRHCQRPGEFRNLYGMVHDMEWEMDMIERANSWEPVSDPARQCERKYLLPRAPANVFLVRLVYPDTGE
ncbi:hypothetical protein C8J56DRAFT_952545 [Mycena floridula]|nr:hypothetical protein C8J56DRAFT_952545 [Mycena floridula]